jgi:hypothetical protein
MIGRELISRYIVSCKLKYNVPIPTKCVSISGMDCLWDGETANEGAGLPRATTNYRHLGF